MPRQSKFDRLELPKQLRVDDMGREVRARAELNHRTLQDELRYLIASGLQHEKSCAGKETPEAIRQAVSDWLERNGGGKISVRLRQGGSGEVRR